MPLLKYLQKRSHSLIGIDISEYCVHLLELCWQNNQTCITAIGKAPILREATSKETAVISAIQEAIQLSHAKSKKVAFALPDTEVISKMIHLDTRLTEKETWLQVQTMAYQYLPHAPQDLCLDYWVEGKAPHHPQLQTIHWVAAKRHTVLARQAIAEKLGLKVAFIETESTALARAAGQPKNIVLPARSEDLQIDLFTKDFQLSLGLALRVKEL